MTDTSCCYIPGTTGPDTSHSDRLFWVTYGSTPDANTIGCDAHLGYLLDDGVEVTVTPYQHLAESATCPDLTTELREVMNRCSAENGSNTPDGILAAYLIGVLAEYDNAVRARDAHYGITPGPGWRTVTGAYAETTRGAAEAHGVLQTVTGGASGTRLTGAMDPRWPDGVAADAKAAAPTAAETWLAQLDDVAAALKDRVQQVGDVSAADSLVHVIALARDIRNPL